MQESFTRLAKPLSPLPKFAKSLCPFKINHLPQLPFLYDAVLAAIITSEPRPMDRFGEDVKTWDESKHTLISLAQRGYLYFKARVMEKVQDLAPGPFRDVDAIDAIIRTMTTTETLALLGCCYTFPKPSTYPPRARHETPRDGVEHAADMFLAYIGALRVPYRHDEKIGFDTICRLDKYLDDLISPKVWIKLDDLVKARTRGQKYGEQQLLHPQRRTLVEMMSNKIPRPTTISAFEPQVPSFKLTTPSTHSSRAPSHRNSPSLLNSPTPRSDTSRLPSRSTGPRDPHSVPIGPRYSLSHSAPTGPIYTLPPRPRSPYSSNSDSSDYGIGPQRRRQRSKRGSNGGQRSGGYDGPY